jgi:hypothetical protein
MEITKKVFKGIITENVLNAHTGGDTFNEFEGSVEDFFDTHEDGIAFFVWCFNRGLPEDYKTPERITAAAVKYPYAMAEVSLISVNLHCSDSIFEKCIFENPVKAFKLPSVAFKAGQLEIAIKEAPQAALANANWFTPKQFELAYKLANKG